MVEQQLFRASFFGLTTDEGLVELSCVVLIALWALLKSLLKTFPEICMWAWARWSRSWLWFFELNCCEVMEQSIGRESCFISRLDLLIFVERDDIVSWMVKHVIDSRTERNKFNL